MHTTMYGSYHSGNENDIMIVDVFEDYAYDAGLRVGDRLKKNLYSAKGWIILIRLSQRRR